jgi:hypothetical protein
MWGSHWTIGLEKRGIPSVFVVDKPFVEDVQVTCEKEGMPSLRRVVVPHPCGDIPDDQYSQIIPKLIEALTVPLNEKEKTPKKEVEKPQRIVFKGNLEETNRFFYRRQWTDGLPIIPPTEEAVKEMLKGTHHSPDEIVTTKMFPENYTVTVEKVAIVGVMAGCKPEYLPVLLAMCEGWGKGNFDSAVRSTNSFAFPVLVNGPIRNEIEMNSGGNAMGPGNQANATIGRFLRLAIISLGGSWPGINDISTQGNPTKYSFCFAENEEATPWEPFHVSVGYKPQDSTVTIFNGCWSHWGNSSNLDTIAQAITSFQWRNGALIIFEPSVAKQLKEKGMSKNDVEEYIWSHATTTMKEFKTNWYNFIEPILKGQEMFGEKYVWPASYLNLPDDAIVQAYPRKYIKVIVVGSGTMSYAQAWKASYPYTVSVDKWR